MREDNPNGGSASSFTDDPLVVGTTPVQVSKQTFAYDNYGNRTHSYEYDFGTGAAGSLIRHTRTSYLTTNDVNGAAYDTVNWSGSSGFYDDLLDRPTKIIRDYNNLAAKSQTVFSYDDANRTMPLTVRLRRAITTVRPRRPLISITTHRRCRRVRRLIPAARRSES